MKLHELLDDLNETKKKKKKKKKCNNYAYQQAGYDKADLDSHSKFDPPNTNYGKNISARRGFVGG